MRFIQVTSKNNDKKMLISSGIIKYIYPLKGQEGSCIECCEPNDKIYSEYRFKVKQSYESIKDVILNHC